MSPFKLYNWHTPPAIHNVARPLHLPPYTCCPRPISLYYSPLVLTKLNPVSSSSLNPLVQSFSTPGDLELDPTQLQVNELQPFFLSTTLLANPHVKSFQWSLVNMEVNKNEKQ